MAHPADLVPRPVRRPSLAIALLGLAALLFGLGGPSQSARAEDGLRGGAGAWEAHVAALPDGGQRCLSRALHRGLDQGDILWVFDPAHRQAFPDGFLVVDRRLADGATAVSVTVSPGGDYRLERADDLHFYSRVDDSAALFADFQRGLSAALAMSGGAAASRTASVSLIGFTAASRLARAACAR